MLISTLLSLCFVFAQETPTVEKKDLTPQEIFEKAAKAHLGGREAVLIEDFKIEFNLIVRDENKGNIEFRAQHMFKRKDRVKTTLDDVDYKIQITTGYSDGRYWLKDKDRGTTILNGREHKKDLIEIDERIRLSKILAKTFSVKRFMEDLRDPKRLSDSVAGDGKRVVVQARAADFVLIKTPGVQQDVDLILYFDAKSYLLREIYATPRSEGNNDAPIAERSEKFVLSEHKTIKDTVFPMSVKIFAGKETKRPVYDITIGNFDFNMGLKEEEFQAPK